MPTEMTSKEFIDLLPCKWYEYGIYTIERTKYNGQICHKYFNKILASSILLMA